MLARAEADREQVLTAELDPRRTETLRRIWPFLRDRRVDAYGDLLKRYRD
jgi:N-carbamoylputrescine amidase